MKLRFLLCLCIVGALAQGDYDEDDGAVNIIYYNIVYNYIVTF